MAYIMTQFVFDGKPEIVEGNYVQNINVQVTTGDGKMSEWKPTSASIPMDMQIENLNGVLAQIEQQAHEFVTINFNS